MSKHNIMPLKRLKSNKIRYYIYFCADHDDFIEFVARNNFQQNRYKFVMADLTYSGSQPVPPTLEYIKETYKLIGNKIAFSDKFMKAMKDKRSSYIDEIELAYCLANKFPIPERLYPDSLRELAQKQNGKTTDG